MNNVIRFVEWKAHTVCVHRPDRWRLHPHFERNTLKRKVLGWMFDQLVKRAILVNTVDERIDYTQRSLNLDKIIPYVTKQWRTICVAYNREPSRLIMGAANYKALMGERDVMQYYQRIPLSDHRVEEHFMNLVIEIVPWMDGVLVLP
jgi:hypothetical protein